MISLKVITEPKALTKCNPAQCDVCKIGPKGSKACEGYHTCCGRTSEDSDMYECDQDCAHCSGGIEGQEVVGVCGKNESVVRELIDADWKQVSYTMQRLDTIYQQQRAMHGSRAKKQEAAARKHDGKRAEQGNNASGRRQGDSDTDKKQDTLSVRHTPRATGEKHLDNSAMGPIPATTRSSGQPFPFSANFSSKNSSRDSGRADFPFPIYIPRILNKGTAALLDPVKFPIVAVSLDNCGTTTGTVGHGKLREYYALHETQKLLVYAANKDLSMNAAAKWWGQIARITNADYWSAIGFSLWRYEGSLMHFWNINRMIETANESKAHMLVLSPNKRNKQPWRQWVKQCKTVLVDAHRALIRSALFTFIRQIVECDCKVLVTGISLRDEEAIGFLRPLGVSFIDAATAVESHKFKRMRPDGVSVPDRDASLEDLFNVNQITARKFFTGE